MKFEPPCLPNTYDIAEAYDEVRSSSPSFVRNINPRPMRTVRIDFENPDNFTAAYCRGLWNQTAGGCLPIEFEAPLPVVGTFRLSAPPQIAQLSPLTWSVSATFEEVPQ